MLSTAGSVACWGNNNYGQLGIGSTTNIGTAPGQMGANLQYVSLSSGMYCQRAVYLIS